jgi:hypothetical protein
MVEDVQECRAFLPDTKCTQNCGPNMVDKKRDILTHILTGELKRVVKASLTEVRHRRHQELASMDGISFDEVAGVRAGNKVKEGVGSRSAC